MARCATSATASRCRGETREQARAAAQLIEVEYEVLPAVIDIADVSATAPAVHAEAPDNRCFQWQIGDAAGVEAPSHRPRMSAR